MSAYSIIGYVSTPGYINKSPVENDSKPGDLRYAYKLAIDTLNDINELIIIKYRVTFKLLEPAIMYDLIQVNNKDSNPTVEDIIKGAENLFEDTELFKENFTIEYIKYHGKKYTPEQFKIISLIT